MCDAMPLASKSECATFECTAVRIHCFAQMACLSAGNLVLQQVAASLFSNIAEATPRDLANISVGLTEIQVLGFHLTNDHLQHIFNRRQKLSSKRNSQ